MVIKIDREIFEKMIEEASIESEVFSQEGYDALYDFFQGLGYYYEFKPKEIWYHFQEHESLKEIAEVYDKKEEEILEYIENETIVIPVGDTGRYIIQLF